MFSLETQSVDARLIRIDENGHIDSALFPFTAFVSSFKASGDIVTQAQGGINFVFDSGSQLEIYKNGSTLYFSSTYQPSNLEVIWANDNYFKAGFLLSNGSGIAIGGENLSTGSEVALSSSGVTSLSGISGHLSLQAAGNLRLVTDIEHNTLGLSVAVLDSNTVSPNSDLVVGNIRTSGGVCIDSVLYSDLINISSSSGQTLIQGPTGTLLYSPFITQANLNSVYFGSSSVFDNLGELHVSGGEILVSQGTDFYGSKALEAASYTISSYTLLDTDLGIYRGTIEHNLELDPLQLHIDFSGNLAGQSQPFEGVRSFNQTAYLTEALQVSSVQVSALVGSILANPDSVQDNALVYYDAIVSGIVDGTLDVMAASGEGISRVESTLSQLPAPTSTNYLNLFTGLTSSTRIKLGNLADAQFAVDTTFDDYLTLFADLRDSVEGSTHNYYTGLTGLVADIQSATVDASTIASVTGIERLTRAVKKLAEPKKSAYLNAIDVSSSGTQQMLGQLSDAQLGITSGGEVITTRKSELEQEPGAGFTNGYTSLLDNIADDSIQFLDISDEGGRLKNALVGSTFESLFDALAVSLKNDLEALADSAAYNQFSALLDGNPDSLTDNTQDVFYALLDDVQDGTLVLTGSEQEGLDLLTEAIQGLADAEVKQQYLDLLGILPNYTKEVLASYVNVQSSFLTLSASVDANYTACVNKATIDPYLNNPSNEDIKDLYLLFCSALYANPAGQIDLVGNLYPGYSGLVLLEEAVIAGPNDDFKLLYNIGFDRDNGLGGIDEGAFQDATQATFIPFCDNLVSKYFALLERNALDSELHNANHPVQNNLLDTYTNLVQDIKDDIFTYPADGSGMGRLYSAIDDLSDLVKKDKYTNLLGLFMSASTQNILGQFVLLKATVSPIVDFNAQMTTLRQNIEGLKFDYLDTFTLLLDSIVDGGLILTGYPQTGWDRVAAAIAALDPSSDTSKKYTQLITQLTSTNQDDLGDLADFKVAYDIDFSAFTQSANVLSANPDNLKNSYTRLIADINTSNLQFIEVPGVGIERVEHAIVSQLPSKQDEYLLLLGNLPASVADGLAHYAEMQVALNATPASLQGLRDAALALLTGNPDSLTNAYFTSLGKLVGESLSRNLDLVEATGSGLARLENALTTYTNLTLRDQFQDLLDALDRQGAEETLGLIGSFVDAQVIMATQSDLLLLPNILAYYTEFDKNTFSVYLKSPTEEPPSATVRILFGTSPVWPENLTFDAYERQATWSGTAWGRYEYKLSTYSSPIAEGDPAEWVTVTVDESAFTLDNINLNSFELEEQVFLHVRAKRRPSRVLSVGDTMPTLSIDGETGDAAWSDFKGSGAGNNEFQVLASASAPPGPISSWDWSSVITGSEVVYSFPETLFDGDPFIFYVRPADDSQNYIQTSGTRLIPLPINLDIDTIYWQASWQGRAGFTYEYQVSSEGSSPGPVWEEVTASNTSITVDVSLNDFEANSPVVLHVRIKDTIQVVTSSVAYLPNLSLDTLTGYAEWDAFPWASDDYEVSVSTSHPPVDWTALGSLEGLSTTIDLASFSYLEDVYLFIRSASQPERYRYVISEMTAVDPYDLILDAPELRIRFKGTKGATYTLFLSQSDDPTVPSLTPERTTPTPLSTIQFQGRFDFERYAANTTIYLHVKSPRDGAEFITSTASVTLDVQLNTTQLEALWAEFDWAVAPDYQYGIVTLDQFEFYLYSPPPDVSWQAPSGTTSTSVNLSEFAANEDIILLVRDFNNSEDATLFHYTSGTVVDLSPSALFLDTANRAVSWQGVATAPYQYQVSTESLAANLSEEDWVGIRALTDTVDLSSYPSLTPLYLHVRTSGIGYPIATSAPQSMPEVSFSFQDSLLSWDPWLGTVEYVYQRSTDPTPDPANWEPAEGTEVVVDISDNNGETIYVSVAPASDPSKYVSTAPISIPAGPSDLTLSGSGAASWDADPAAGGYEYQTVTHPTSTPTPPNSAGWVSTSSTSVNVSLGNSYGSYVSVYVRSTDPGTGEPSTGYQRVTVLVDSPAPANLQLSMPGTGYAKMQATWDAMSGVVAYEYIYTTSATPPSLSGWSSTASITFSVVLAETYHRGTIYFHVRRSGSSNPFTSSSIYVPGAPLPDSASLALMGTDTATWLPNGRQISGSWTASADVSHYYWSITTGSTPPGVGGWWSSLTTGGFNYYLVVDNSSAPLANSSLGQQLFFHVRPGRLGAFYGNLSLTGITSFTSDALSVPSLPSLNLTSQQIDAVTVSYSYDLVDKVILQVGTLTTATGDFFGSSKLENSSNVVTTTEDVGTRRTVTLKVTNYNDVTLYTKARIYEINFTSYAEYRPTAIEAPPELVSSAITRLPDVNSVSLTYDSIAGKLVATWANPWPEAIGLFQYAITVTSNPNNVSGFEQITTSGVSAEKFQSPPGSPTTWYAHVRIYKSSVAYGNNWVYYGAWATTSIVVYPP